MALSVSVPMAILRFGGQNLGDDGVDERFPTLMFDSISDGSVASPAGRHGPFDARVS